MQKYPIPNFEILSLWRAKRKGVGGIFARPHFPISIFSAAEFKMIQ
jgi:hypothetical protein